MAKRKPDSSLAGQLDMFGGWSSAPNDPPPNLMAIVSEPPPQPSKAANDQPDVPTITESDVTVLKEEQIEAVSASEDPIAPSQNIAAIKPVTGWENDEWWTTAMVCSFLKLGRKAIWERTRHPTLGFPQPTHFGSCRHRWRAGEVKAWASFQG
jgi:predicted DNA-binding transcriptional regulator AlpA